MLDSPLREQFDRLQQLMADQPFVVLTGAGISTPSGIPDYRDNQGVRRGRQPMMYQEFLSARESRRRYWARAMLGWPRVRQAQPNVAHEGPGQFAKCPANQCADYPKRRHLARPGGQP